jgi:hypothetical protein
MTRTHVPGYSHDIFVSYAHLDNEAIPPEEGWVTTLLRRLPLRAAQHLGQEVSLWNDFQLPGHVEISQDILGAVRGAATLVVVMSPAYMNSEWCALERNAFLEVIEDRVRSGSRVFVVHKLRTEREHRPTVFRGLTGYQFWKQDGLSATPQELDPKQDPEGYYRALDKLSWELTRELERLADQAKVPSPASAGTVPSGSAPRVQRAATGPVTPAPAVDGESRSPVTVFLAEPTDDLEDEHAQVRLYLEQAHLRVLPESPYPVDASGFRQAVERDLQASTVFVQLLSAVIGKKPTGATKSRTRLQWEWAENAHKPVLQWRLPESENRVRDADQRQLLELSTVRTGSLEDFKRQIWEQVSAVSRRPADSPAGPKAFLLLDADKGDEELAIRVSNLVADCDIDVGEPWRRGTPESMSLSLIKHFETCDALIIVYGSVDPDWVDKQLDLWRKYAWKRRNQKPELFAVYEGPGEPRPAVTVRLAGVQVVNLRHGVDEEKLRALLCELSRKHRMALEETRAAGPS